MLLYADCITVLLGGRLAEYQEKNRSEKSAEDQRFTSIRLRKETVRLLKERGRKSESYDDVIRRLLEKRRR